MNNIQYWCMIAGGFFGAVSITILLSTKSKYKAPKEKGKHRRYLTNGEYLKNRLVVWLRGKGLKPPYVKNMFISIWKSGEVK